MKIPAIDQNQPQLWKLMDGRQSKVTSHPAAHDFCGCPYHRVNAILTNFSNILMAYVLAQTILSETADLSAARSLTPYCRQTRYENSYFPFDSNILKWIFYQKQIWKINAFIRWKTCFHHRQRGKITPNVNKQVMCFTVHHTDASPYIGDLASIFVYKRSSVNTMLYENQFKN